MRCAAQILRGRTSDNFCTPYFSASDGFYPSEALLFAICKRFNEFQFFTESEISELAMKYISPAPRNRTVSPSFAEEMNFNISSGRSP